MSSIRLHAMLLDAAAIVVLNQIVDWLHSGFLRLGRMNYSSCWLFPDLLRHLSLHSANDDQVLVILLMILTIILPVFSPAAFRRLWPLHIFVGFAHVHISGNSFSKSALGLRQGHNLDFALFFIGKWLLSENYRRHTSSCLRELTAFLCQYSTFRLQLAPAPLVVILEAPLELDLVSYLNHCLTDPCWPNWLAASSVCWGDCGTWIKIYYKNKWLRWPGQLTTFW